jgi:hypothetical protein
LADAGYDATPQTPDATMTSVEVIQMPEDVPPAPEAVVEVQATFGGVTTDDAHDADFQEAIRAAVAEALDVDESQVGTRVSHLSHVGLLGLHAPSDRTTTRGRRPSLLSLLSLSFSPSPSRGHRVAGDHALHPDRVRTSDSNFSNPHFPGGTAAISIGAGTVVFHFVFFSKMGISALSTGFSIRFFNLIES